MTKFSIIKGGAVLGVALLVAGLAPPVMAKEKGDILVRMRALAFITDTDGTTDIATGGGRARTNNDFIPELDFTYFFTDNIAAELILAYTQHSVEVLGSGAGNLDLGSVKLLPPILSLQYHFQPKSKFSPYLGVGVIYAIWFDTDKGRSVDSVDYSNEFGYSFQAGFDYAITDQWSFNVDVKKVFVDTDITVNGGAINAKGVDLDPLVAGIGIGYRF